MANRFTKGIGIFGKVIAKSGIALGLGAGLYENAGTPTNGAAGTLFGVAGPGAILIDVTNKVLYVNTNTKASPTWTAAATALTPSADGLGQMGLARVTINPTLNAGERTIAAHTYGVTIPISAWVVGGFLQVNTVFHSAGADAGTVAISVEGANDIISAAAVSGAPYSTIGAKAIIPKANTPETTGILTTAARLVTMTVAGQALTAGKATLFLSYVQGTAQA